MIRDVSSMRAESLFEYDWVTFGLGDIRPTKPTYSSSVYDLLPPIPKLAPDCAWLPPLHPTIDAEMEDYRLDEKAKYEYARQLKTIEREAISLGIELPSTFLALARSFELQERIPSCTACYFDLPERIIESPFRQGDFILRFLNDQQVCVCWYIYLPTNAPHFVISSSADYDEPFLDSIDFEASPKLVQNCMESTSIAAKSFDEFIYRFWIENVIWFKLNEKIPMLELELDYIRHIAPDYTDPNGR